MTKKKKWILNGVLMGVTGLLTLTVSIVMFGPLNNTIDKFVFPGKVIVDKNSQIEQDKTPQQIADQIEEEGAVLLKNDNLLPLSPEDLRAVNVFGWSSTQWIPGGSGSGRVVSSKTNMNAKIGLLDALTDAGYKPNTELTSFYSKYCKERPFFNAGTLHSDSYQFNRLVEPKMSEYNNTLLNNAKQYSDTAIVTLGRVSGESNDAPKVQYKGNKDSKTIDDNNRTYLEISTEEEELLKYVGANYENVIVILNTTNTMELGFLKTIPGLDACLLVGGTGVESAKVIPEILDGTITPSGKLADTYAYDLQTAASYANSGLEGEGQYTNGKGLYPYDGTKCGNYSSDREYDRLSYIDYCEDIYIGYKWYETADTDGYWDDVNNQYGRGYDGVVQFPFGYGLSYTSFDWELESGTTISYSNQEEIEYEVKVKVTNTGEMDGKDVVQLYYEPPYTTGGIEKSSANLLAFAKTKILEPNESETLTLTFTNEDMLSYDCYDKNNDNHKGYELEKGEYNIKIQTDSHSLKDMKNNTLTMNVKSTEHFDKDLSSGNDVNNKFTGSDAMDGTSIDGSDTNSNITYLSRADFKATFPKQLKANRELTENGKKYNLYTSELANSEINENDKDIVTGEKNNLKIFENDSLTDLAKKLGKDFNDPDWETLLNEMSIDEMKNLTLHGYDGTRAIPSIGKPELRDLDGPNQIGSFNVDTIGIGYPNSTTLAQTFNKQLATEFGNSIGNEARNLGIDGWYGPGMNTHRSPFGGRNYEYYSEDAKLSADMAQYVITGSNKAGTYCYLKHIALYDQDSMRDGLYTFTTEQAFREIYLRPFKAAIENGHAQGVMTSYNRIGTVWAGGSKALLTGILRDEWGFNGCILTDYADHHQYMNLDHALRAGGDLFMDGWNNNGTFLFETNSNTFKQKLRQASKHIIYSWIAQTPNKAKISKSPWRTVLGVIDGVIAVGIATWAFFIYFFPTIKEKKNQKPIEDSQN